MTQAGPVRTPDAPGHCDWPRGGGGTQAKPVTCVPQVFQLGTGGEAIFFGESLFRREVRDPWPPEDRNKRRGSQTW